MAVLETPRNPKPGPKPEALAWAALDVDLVLCPSTSAFCQARQRLPMDWLQALVSTVTNKIEESAKELELWYGRHVKICDGVTCSMPDTPQNQQLFPQPESAKPGCGFPVVRLVVIFSLSTGTILNYAYGSLHVDELTLWRTLWDSYETGDVVLADREFCTYADICLLLLRGVDVVMRKRGTRTANETKIKRLGKDDWLVEWPRPRARQPWMSPEQWEDLPQKLLLRRVSYCVEIPGFRTEHVTVMTTLLDPKAFAAEVFAELYRWRWQAELFLRDIKISMNMDPLRTKSPEMIHRELLIYIIVYNLIRAMMSQAARQARIHPARLSFKASVQFIREWAPKLACTTGRKRSQLRRVLLDYLALLAVFYRPNRTETRARKRRPRNYQLLNKPRHQFREIPHRSRYTRGDA